MSKKVPLKSFNDTHKSILHALAICQSLTIPHFSRLQFCCFSNLRRGLKELRTCRKQPLIKQKKQGMKGGGSRPAYHYLTPYGQARTATYFQLPIAFVKAPSYHPETANFEHRFQQLCFLVDLYGWTQKEGIQLEFFEHDFECSTGGKGIHHIERATRMQLPP